MKDVINNNHLSSQFNEDLSKISNGIMNMGGILESQLVSAISALKTLDITEINEIINLNDKITDLDIKALRNLANIISRRQPTAKDLRLILAASKISSNIERAGDELVKVADKLKKLITTGSVLNKIIKDLRTVAKLTLEHLHLSLDALARLEIDKIETIEKSHHEISDSFNSFTRQLITYMMEDARTISSSLDLIFIAKAFERISDHAQCIAESLHYILEGEDIRIFKKQMTKE